MIIPRRSYQILQLWNPSQPLRRKRNSIYYLASRCRRFIPPKYNIPTHRMQSIRSHNQISRLLLPSFHSQSRCVWIHVYHSAVQVRLDPQTIRTLQQPAMLVCTMDVPVWRPVPIMRWLLQWTFDEDLAVLPSHHFQVDGLGTVILDVFVNTQVS